MRQKDVGPHYDMWALGVAIYRMMAGKVPYKFSS